MSNYIDRMKEEFEQLESRIDKLELFIRSDQFLKLHKKDQELLTHQAKHMVSYYNVLEVRLACAINV